MLRRVNWHILFYPSLSLSFTAQRLSKFVRPIWETCQRADKERPFRVGRVVFEPLYHDWKQCEYVQSIRRGIFSQLVARSSLTLKSCSWHLPNCSTRSIRVVRVASRIISLVSLRTVAGAIVWYCLPAKKLASRVWYYPRQEHEISLSEISLLWALTHRLFALTRALALPSDGRLHSQFAPSGSELNVVHNRSPVS